MKRKLKFVECTCGIKIKGLSELHAKRNLQIHKRVSRRHKERMELLRKK